MWLKYLFHAGLKYSISTKGYKSKKLTQTPELTIFAISLLPSDPFLVTVSFIIKEKNFVVHIPFPKHTDVFRILLVLSLVLVLLLGTL